MLLEEEGEADACLELGETRAAAGAAAPGVGAAAAGRDFGGMWRRGVRVEGGGLRGC